jgi:hypothetical protein
MGPTRWPLDVYMANHIADERQATAWNDAGRSAHLKALLCESQGKEHMPTNYEQISPTPPPHRKTKLYANYNNNVFFLEPTLPEHELVPPPTVLLDSGATLNFIDQQFYTSHHLPTITLPNKIRIIMADGRIMLASQYCTFAMNFSGFPTTYVFVITYLQSSFHCVLGFFVLYNPVIDWQTGFLKFNDSHTSACPIHPRPANVEIVEANAMAREINEKDPPIVFLCAILKGYDAASVTYTDNSLADDIACLTTDQSPTYTDKIRSLTQKTKSICKPID